MASVHDYIQQTAQEAVLESSGKFSIDFLRARDKLERFRLPSSSHYLLKVIQAAVESGAPEVNIKVLNQATIARFTPAKGSPLAHLTAITRGLENPLEIPDSSVRALCQGLLGSLLNANESVCWRINHRDGTAALWLGASGNRTEVRRYLAGPETECVLTQFRPSTWKFWLSARNRAEEAETLKKYARHCSIPVRLDGVNLQDFWTPLPRSPDRPYFFYQFFWAGKGPIRIKMPPLSSFFRDGLCYKYRPVAQYPGSRSYPESVMGQTCFFFEIDPSHHNHELLQCNKAAAVNSTFVAEAEVLFVDRGVILTPTRVDLGCPGLQIVYPFEELDLDATGFQVIQNEKFARLLPALQEIATFMRMRIKSQWKNFGPLYSAETSVVVSSEVLISEFADKFRAAFGPF